VPNQPEGYGFLAEDESGMNNGNGNLNWIANFIWGIADDVLRDYYVRGKYRDTILPMTVIRRLDAVLEPNKKAVLDLKKQLDGAGITNQDAALRQAAGQAFYNTSPFLLRDLRSRAKPSSLEPISKPIWMASRPMSRRYWINSSSATKYQP
jgi:type I restriction-modification system DNA methylase subunit